MNDAPIVKETIGVDTDGDSCKREVQKYSQGILLDEIRYDKN